MLLTVYPRSEEEGNFDGYSLTQWENIMENTRISFGNYRRILYSSKLFIRCFYFLTIIIFSSLNLFLCN